MKNRMIYLLFAAWSLLFWCTVSYFIDQHDNARKEYGVSYMMKTETGTLTGFMMAQWKKNATRTQILDTLTLRIAEKQKEEGQPTPVGEVVILNVFEKPWN